MEKGKLFRWAQPSSQSPRRRNRAEPGSASPDFFVLVAEAVKSSHGAHRLAGDDPFLATGGQVLYCARPARALELLRVLRLAPLAGWLPSFPTSQPGRASFFVPLPRKRSPAARRADVSAPRLPSFRPHGKAAGRLSSSPLKAAGKNVPRWNLP